MADLPRYAYALLDPRLIELRARLETDADGRLNRGYRRLEDMCASDRTEAARRQALFRRFEGAAPPLVWDVPDASEGTGRALLFKGVYMAYRNPRAHREMARGQHLAEFLHSTSYSCWKQTPSPILRPRPA